MLINELHRYLKVIPKIVTTSKRIWLMKQSNMGCRLYFKAFTAYRFYKVNLKVEKSELTVQLF
jgi:hypothetical protein